MQQLRKVEVVDNLYNISLYGHRRPMKQQVHNKVRTYLNNRGIIDRVIDESGIVCSFEYGPISIPVRDKEGRHIFWKYRRNPWTDTGPKYVYEKGSSASLFGIESIDPGKKPIFITEGEFDSLVLRSHGYNAVSVTGGCGSLKAEWFDELLEAGHTLLITFDADGPGVSGAVSALLKLKGEAKIVQLPEDQDVTDYWQAGGDMPLLESSMAYEYFTPTTQTKGGYNQALRDNLKIRYTMLNAQRDLRWLDALQEVLSTTKKTIGRSKKDSTINSSDLQGLRDTPIGTLLQFNGAGFAKCIWHNEDTPSMKLYKDQNRVYCFGCKKGGDAIDVMMELDGVTFKELLDKHGI